MAATTSETDNPSAEDSAAASTVIRRKGGRTHAPSSEEKEKKEDSGVAMAPTLAPPEEVGIPPEEPKKDSPAAEDTSAAATELPDLETPEVLLEEEDEDFSSLFEASEGRNSDFAPGDQVRGNVVAITKDTAFIDLGGKSEGFIPIGEFRDNEGEITISEGDEIEAWIVEIKHGIELSKSLKGGSGDIARLEAAYEAGIPVEAMVSGVNKGGLELKLGGKRGFCPSSQIDVIYVEDPSVYMGRTLRFRIVNFDADRDLVLSRRAILEAEAAEQAAETLKTLAVGAIMTGKVKNVRDFGAFVDLGGIEGLLHVSEISWERITDPEKVLQQGQQVRVKVTRIDEEGERISLSMKALQNDPWLETMNRFSEGTRFTGKVVRIMDFGVFVELEPGIEGMVHISELAWRRINHPKEVVEEGQDLDVVVTKVDLDRRRIGLSSRSAEGDPWSIVEAKFPVGTHADGTVEHVESFGVFVTLAAGVTGLLPRVEMNGTPGSDLRRTYPVGHTVRVKVVTIDGSGRKISLSEKAILEDEENAEMANWHQTKKKEAEGAVSDLALALQAALNKKDGN